MGSVLSSVKYTPDGIPYHNFDDFKGMEKLDNGGYGTVYKAKGTLKGFTRKKQTVVIKSFNVIDDYSKREIEILKTRTHPNVIKLFGVIWDGKFTNSKNPIYTGYVMEYLELGSLHRVIYDPSETYDIELIKTWIRQIAAGLQYLHKYRIIHRDVKPENILLAARDHLKLADFGLARNISGNNTYTSGNMGTDPYMAPEVIGIEKNYGPPADIYSLGVTIWEIARRQRPQGILEIENIANQCLSHIITKCLQQNASDRPSISEIIQFEPTTILIIDYNCMAVLSTDRSEWRYVRFKTPIYVRRSIYFNEEIYIVGGDNDKSLYKLDKNLEWIRLADMNIGRLCIKNSCLECNGYIWVFGGWNRDDNCLKRVDRYDPNNNKWTLMPDMTHPRMFAATTVSTDRVIFSGGTNGSPQNTVECFNPEDGSWAELPNMPKALYSHSLVSYKNKIISLGGLDEEYETQNKVYELDPLEENPTWKSLPPMKYSAKEFAGIVLDGEIYAIGGSQVMEREIEFLDRVEIFDGVQLRDGPTLPFEWNVTTSVIIIPQSLAHRLCNYKPE